MANPLTDVLPWSVRRWLYFSLAVAGLVVGALEVAGVNTGPATDVLAYLAVALGLTAASNPPRDDAEVEPYPVPVDEASETF